MGLSGLYITAGDTAAHNNGKSEPRDRRDPMALCGTTADDINPARTLWTLNYGNYGTLLIMGNAGLI